MGIHKDCLEKGFHALVSWSVPAVARVYFSASQINTAGLPNDFTAAIFMTAKDRYSNIENELLPPGRRDFEKSKIKILNTFIYHHLAF